jgi:SAM-dependent methyltransferase
MTAKEPEPLISTAVSAAFLGDALDLACGTGRHTLWLARQGWRVTAVDYSAVALEKLKADAQHLPVRIVCADLETGEFEIARDTYTLVVDTCFLDRSLFPSIRTGLRPGGVFFGVFPMEGMNPAYLVSDGELTGYFHDWEIIHSFEGRPSPARRLRSELIARKPSPA